MLQAQTLQPPAKESIAHRYASLRERIVQAARGAGRAAEDVRLIAVSKMHDVATIREAVEAGAREFGENRVQEAEEKIETLGREPLRWHLIGHLQANKAKRAVQLFEVIQSVDSVKLVERLERLCAEENRARLSVLVQVDLGGEATKTGASVAELPDLIKSLQACERVRLTGLMCVPPFFENAEDVRPFFRRLRELRDEWREAFEDGRGELSMGMSHDFEVAIEEGATLVRVGTQLFGARDYKGE